MARSLRKKSEAAATLTLDDDDAPWSTVITAVPAPAAAPAAIRTPMSPNAAPGESQPAAAERLLQGHIDVAKWPRVKGWVWDPEAPSERVRLEFVEGPRRLLTVLASLGRPDLAVAGIGDGMYGFDVDLNDSPIGAGRRALTVRCAATAAELPGSPITLDVPATGDAPSTPSAAPEAARPLAPPKTPNSPHFRGYVDGVDAEWRLSGWAYDPAGDKPLTVELVEGEAVLATARAGEFREDLLAAGFRSGNCAFHIRVPAKLFDGEFHNLQVYGLGAAAREPISKPFGIVFPRRGPLRSASSAAVSAIEIFEQVSGTPAPKTDRPGNEIIEEASAVFQQLGHRFGHAAALGLLYAYVLRRPIDNEGLATRLTRIHSEAAAYRNIVQEVMYSDEAGLIHGPSKYLSLHPLKFLQVWLDGRFGMLELPA